MAERPRASAFGHEPTQTMPCERERRRISEWLRPLHTLNREKGAWNGYGACASTGRITKDSPRMARIKEMIRKFQDWVKAGLRQEIRPPG